MTAPTVAPLTDAAVLERIHEHKLVESVDHMSPSYLEGMKRILTVSADTELISAPAYLHAARYCAQHQHLRLGHRHHPG